MKLLTPLGMMRTPKPFSSLSHAKTSPGSEEDRTRLTMRLVNLGMECSEWFRDRTRNPGNQRGTTSEQIRAQPVKLEQSRTENLVACS